MDVNVAKKLLDGFGKCIKCGSDKVGNESGKLIIEGNTFTRECKCGHKIVIGIDLAMGKDFSTQIKKGDDGI